VKRLVLLGGGHAHVHVLDAMRRARWTDVDAMLVTPHERQAYSGMLPGVVAGHYRPDQAVIPLSPLASAADVTFVRASGVGIDASARELRLSDGRTIAYDLLSIDIGSAPALGAIPGADAHGLYVRPIEAFLARLERLPGRAGADALRVVVIGGGAAGFELSLAMDQRLKGQGVPSPVTWVTGGSAPLAGYPARVIGHALDVLRQRGVEVQRSACVGVDARAVRLADGAVLGCDLALLATGAAAPAWLAGSGLTLDGRGFIATGPTLQSVSHPEVFAAGDVATRQDVDHPRSGVYAVRAGPPLARNLRRWLAGQPLQAHRPQARTLNLLSCGDLTAIASWGSWSARGRWVWRWKDRIDRAFIARFGGGLRSA
jgi:pyridine nucleotide-disulfide oxidoreductase family protein